MPPVVAKRQQTPSQGPANLPAQVARDFNFLNLLKEEVNKSGELYLKVALWKVYLRLPQHCEDLFELDADEGRLLVKKMTAMLLAYCENLISEGEKVGGLDQQKHGVTESIVRDNMLWLREKLVLMEIEPGLQPSRKEHILNAFSGGPS